MVWLQTRVDKSGKSCNVSWVEDHNHVLYVWAVFLDVIAEVSSNLAVTLEQVFTSHAVLTWSTTRRDDVLSTSESLLSSFSNLFRVTHIFHCRSHISDVSTWESALLDFIEHTVNTWFIDIIKTDVRSKAEHQNALYHV